MKKIVLLSAFATPHRSGAEACVEEVSSVLKGRYDFVIVTARMRRDLPKREVLHSGVPLIRIGVGSTVDKWLFPFLAPFVAAHEKPDLLHAVLETFAGLALLFCRFTSSGVPRLLTMQTTNRRFLKTTVLRSPDQLTAISKVLVDAAKSAGRDAIRIPNGLNLKDIPHATKVPGRVLFAGRLRAMKGVDTLLRAFALLKGDATLHIVGDGELRPSLERLSKELGIADRVTFLGYVPTPTVYDEFAAAEIFCSLSRSEAFGNVFIEAQAARCAVIGTTIQGIPDIVHDGKTGILVPPDDPAAAAKALERLLHDAPLRTAMAQAGAANAAKYDWSTIAEKYAAVYEQMLTR